MLLKEVEKLKTFDKYSIPEKILIEMNIEFERHSKKAFEIDNGNDENYSFDDQKKALGIVGAEWLQRYFYIKTWIIMINDERYVSKTERERFKSIIKWFDKIKDHWEKSILS